LGEGVRSSEALDSLIAHIERQPHVFHLGWTFSELRRKVALSNDDGVAASREFFLGLLDAVSGTNREEILTGLKRMKGR
jgi:hypothetical protein